ncbi:MAG: histidine kinase [Ilumatobacter sp.]|uniref:sensor histidine kinase n=2 Tax=Ilumatobacter sp. TaxID=1967498 RepID=UPI00329711DF
MNDGLVRTLLAEPAVTDPPRRVWRDWALVGVLVPSAAIEGLLRDDLVWAPWSAVAVMLLSFTLLWRRSHPLPATVITMGTVVGLDQVARIVTGGPVEVYTAAFLLIHVYALFRWGSGRHCAVGLGAMALTFASSQVVAYVGVGDAIGGAIVFLFPAVLGVEVRHLVRSRLRDREEVKTRERELLARELHDTVAHHVSAIAIQAQAGRVVGVTDPAAALDALTVIEAEASRTLAEMRSIVGTLRRSDDAAELAPLAGLTEIMRLADRTSPGPHIDIRLDGVDHVNPTVGAALYRIAQESITNARRHATGATRVSVSVDGAEHAVRLVVVDDGATPRSAAGSGGFGAGGFGLVGMTERAELLGGTLRAGPGDGCGWRVEATIPREAVS